MGISEIYIVKRDGKRAPFSVEKIKRAISKAFLSVGGYATDDDLTSVLSRVRVSDGMSVEEIQNQVEVALMAERYFAVAKSYMLYRQKHSEDREDREKLEFLINYCDAKNPATGSKYDANANVENKNIATLIGELPTILSYEIVQSRVPYDDLYSSKGEMLVPDFSATISRLQTEIYGSTTVNE